MQSRYLIFILIIFYSAALPGADFTKEREEIKSGIRKEARAEWWGYNAADSTAILQAALNSGVSKLIISKQGGPWVICRTLKIPSNIEIIFEKGVELKAKSGAFQKITEMFLDIRNRKNVKMRGPGLISMRRGDYRDKTKYKPSEWRHTLAISRSSNISIDGLTFSKSGGDGIYINNVNDIKINNVTCSDNYRQGISVISASNLSIKNSTFINTSGTPPTAGIDFEPNRWYQCLVNCKVENCNFINNAGSGIEVMLLNFNQRSKPISMSFRRCLIKNNGKGITVFNRHVPSVGGSIEFDDCRIEDSKIYSFMTNGQTIGGYSVTLKNCVIDNSKTVEPNAVKFIAGAVSGPLGNLHVNELKVIDPRPGLTLFYFDSWKFSPLKNLSGVIKSRSGKTFDLKHAVEQSQKAKPLSTAKIDCKKLVPVKNTIDKNIKLHPLRNRNAGTFIQYAAKNQNIKLNIIYSPVGISKSIKISAYSPSGKEIGTWSINAKNASQGIKLTAKEPGIYRFKYYSGGGIFTSDDPGCGYLADKPLRGNHTPARMYFLVPAGVDELALRISGGESESEHVSVNLLDPAGNIIQSAKKITEPKLIYQKRDNSGKDEIWSIQVTHAADDFSIMLLGKSVPILSNSPDQILKPIN